MPRSILSQEPRNVPYFLGFNSYDKDSSPEDRYRIEFDCYLCKGLLTSQDKDKFLSYDAKIANSWKTLYDNAEQWLNASKINLNSDVDCCKGENYGDVPAPFKVTASTVEENVVFKVGNCNITIKEACTNLEWDSKTGIVLGLPEGESKSRPIYYTGTSYGVIPPIIIPEKDTIYYQKGTIIVNSLGDKYVLSDGKWTYNGKATSPFPFEVEYDYWYY